MTPEKLKELKFQVRRHMNGEVAQIMKGLDDAYKANYGISLQHAKDIAMAEDLSPDDCTELWETGWRDLMLVAAAAMRRHDPKADVIVRWTMSVPTIEMADALPFLLTGYMTDIEKLVVDLHERDMGFDFAIICSTVARALIARDDQRFYAAAPPQPSQLRDVWFESFAPVVTLAVALLNFAILRGEWSYAEARSISFLARQWCRLQRYGCIFEYDVPGVMHKVMQVASQRPDPNAILVARDIEDENAMVKSSL